MSSTRSMFRVGSHTSAVKASQLPQAGEVVVAPTRPVRQTTEPSLLNVIGQSLPNMIPRQHQDIADIKGLSVKNYPVLVEVIGFLRTAEDSTSAIEIVSNVLNKGFDIWLLPTMEDFEKQYRINIRMEFAKRGGTVLRDLICPKCRGNEYIVTEAQLASADESNTEFRVCVNCLK